MYHYCKDSTNSFQRVTDWRPSSCTQPLNLERIEEEGEEREEGEEGEARDVWLEGEWNLRSYSGRERKKTILVM